MQAEHHTTDHEQKTAHGAMDGWICRPIDGRAYIISLWGSAHAIMCVQISTRVCMCGLCI